MKHDAFSYQFSFGELKYFLFGKKICPKCGGMMSKHKGYETRKGSELNGRSDPFFISNARVKHYIYNFKCQQCGTQYRLEELAKNITKK